MTIGTAIVARMNVRSTGDSVRNQSPRARLRMVSVGKTASQIMSASWCLFGGGTGEDCGAGRLLDMVVLLDVGGTGLGSFGSGTDQVLKPLWRSRTACLMSSSTRSAFRAMAAADPWPAAVMTWARGSAAFPATQTPGTLVLPVASAITQPVSSRAQP